MEFLIQKKSKLVCLAVAGLMTSGMLFSTGINAHAEEVISNPTQAQTTLSDIEASNNTIYDGEHSIQERSPHSKWHTKNAPTPWSIVKSLFHHK